MYKQTGWQLCWLSACVIPPTIRGIILSCGLKCIELIPANLVLPGRNPMLRGLLFHSVERAELAHRRVEIEVDTCWICDLSSLSIKSEAIIAVAGSSSQPPRIHYAQLFWTSLVQGILELQLGDTINKSAQAYSAGLVYITTALSSVHTVLLSSTSFMTCWRLSWFTWVTWRMSSFGHNVQQLATNWRETNWTLSYWIMSQYREVKIYIQLAWDCIMLLNKLFRMFLTELISSPWSLQAILVIFSQRASYETMTFLLCEE